MIDWSSIPFVQKVVKKERIVMSVYDEIDSLKAKIAEAIESGTEVKDAAEDTAQKLNDIVDELGNINEYLGDNKNALDSIQENLDALDEQKSLADDLGIST